MQRSKPLTKRQLTVIEEMFAGNLDEPEVLKKHRVTPALYNRWLTDERFTQAFEQRMARAYRAGHIFLARHSTEAANKLAKLAACEKEEIARRACLDIINMHQCPVPRVPTNAAPNTGESPEATLPPETVSRILAALAEPESEE